MGGGTLLDARWSSLAREHDARSLLRLANVRCLAATAVVGAYGHGVFGALETLTPEEAAQFGALRERLHVIRARAVLIATGALERLIAFPGNDRPGRDAGRRRARLLQRATAWRSGSGRCSSSTTTRRTRAPFALAGCGGAQRRMVDVRRESQAAERARALGLEVHAGAVVRATAWP